MHEIVNSDFHQAIHHPSLVKHSITALPKLCEHRACKCVKQSTVPPIRWAWEQRRRTGWHFLYRVYSEFCSSAAVSVWVKSKRTSLIWKRFFSIFLKLFRWKVTKIFGSWSREATPMTIVVILGPFARPPNSSLHLRFVS